MRYVIVVLSLVSLLLVGNGGGIAYAGDQYAPAPPDHKNGNPRRAQEWAWATAEAARAAMEYNRILPTQIIDWVGGVGQTALGLYDRYDYIQNRWDDNGRWSSRQRGRGRSRQRY